MISQFVLNEKELRALYCFLSNQSGDLPLELEKLLDKIEHRLYEELSIDEIKKIIDLKEG